MSPEERELSGATATATPEPETQVAPGEGLGEAPAAGEPTGAGPTGPTAEPSAEGETAPADEGQPPASLPEDWQEHPDAKPILQERYNSGRGEREKQLRQEMDRREGRYGTEVQDAYRQGSAAEVVTKLVEALEDGFDLDDADGQKALGKVLRGHEEWAGVFTGARAKAAEAALVRQVKTVVNEVGLSGETVGELADLEQELSWKVRHGEAKLADALRELIQTSYKHVKELGAAEEKQRRDKLEKEITGAEGRAAERGKKPPPAAPSGSGGGGSGLRYGTKAEARALHVQGKISNTQMREVNADPTIPEGM